MEYKYLGKTGVKVSTLCFGTMSFGGDADESESAKMFNRCRDLGINFFDCANVYANGISEEILGRFIADCRDEVIITSKVFARTGPGENERGSSRRNIILAVEKSLKRLNTDRLELYFFHGFDNDTPIEDSLQAMDDLVRQGKILYPAVSNWSAWQIAKALGISSRDGFARFECVQPMYNLVKRQVESEILPLCQSEQLGVIPYSPLGGGLLTGKYRDKQKADKGRLLENEMYVHRYAEPHYHEVVERYMEYCGEKNISPVTLAIAWVRAHPAVTAPIIGARSLEQLEPSLAALEVKVDPAWWLEISALSPGPPIATDRREEFAESPFTRQPLMSKD